MPEVERVGTQVDVKGRFPSVVGLSNGMFVVSWRSEDSTKGTVGQLYSADVKRIGSEVSLQQGPARLDLPGGGHAVIRFVEGIITGQVVDKAGAKTEDGLRVGSAGGRSSSLALLENGNLIGAAQAYRQDQDIEAQRFDSDGKAIGVATLVNTLTTGEQKLPSVAALKGGGYVVTWSDYGTRDIRDIKAQVYTDKGAKVGTEFTVNTSLEGEQWGSAVIGLEDGGYVVTWRDAQRSTLTMQRFSAEGSRIGGEIDIEGSNRGRYPVAATLVDGTLAVGWQAGNLADYGGVKAQIFTQEGKALTPIFDIDSTGRNTQVALSLSPTADGGFIAAWTDASYEDNGRADNDDGGTYSGSFQLFKPRSQTLETRGATLTRTVDDLARYERILTFDDAAHLRERVSLRLADSGTIDLKDQLEGLRGATVVTSSAGGNTVYTGKQADKLIAEGTNNDLHGGRGSDTYLIRGIDARVFEKAGEGRDSIYTNLSYVLERGSEVELLKAIAGGGLPSFRLEGNEKGQTIDGANGNDIIKGWGGNDRIDGKLGADTLFGGSGKDIFVFKTGPTPKTTITDFTHSDDTMELWTRVFAGVNKGTLEDFRFKVISSATSTKGVDQSDRILYDKVHGDLYFDQDGSQSRYSRFKFAEVSDNKYLEADDFLIV